MDEIQRFKEEVLKEYPRLKTTDSFKFRCHPGVSCFNACCGDVNIFLTPYDIIRLKNHLGMSSQDFLSKYTIMPFDKNLTYPVVLLKMNDDDTKSCPFVREEGCSVYEDRPWACRMYPLGLASPGDGSKEADQEFFFLLKESVCKGFNEEREQTIEEWLENEGIREYNEYGELFKQLTTNPFFSNPDNVTPKKMEMFFTVCYNIDKFRQFVLDTSFLEKFDVEPEVVEKIKEDDVELFKFGCRWLRFSLFGEQTMKINENVAGEVKKVLKEREERLSQKAPKK
jgi:hypothetical protein